MTDGTKLRIRPLPDGRPGIAVAGEIDMTNAEDLRAALVTAAQGDSVVVDLTAVTYLGSAGLSVLFAFVSTVRAELLVNELLAPTVSIAGLDRVARIATV
ncbi:anti-anti-sigma factor [Virgisporangium aliadipatigenens]|uniref:Anti-anti-sigma factor n=1 Tax=Virgisporangium aliadipatigenens TaxID=741659 RepID=A0A8J4DR78_9ACTN|nr:STAS domain-containing protein [Virgisporangium aliadipatigenens]GIJ46498.1 anti-anti-sigma factor [Virgisporangium aliadipatigenens]